MEAIEKRNNLIKKDYAKFSGVDLEIKKLLAKKYKTTVKNISSIVENK
jgi:hypothetical protein